MKNKHNKLKEWGHMDVQKIYILLVNFSAHLTAQSTGGIWLVLRMSDFEFVVLDPDFDLSAELAQYSPWTV